MRIEFESYMWSAWLLSKYGTEIEVYKHPNENFEFDSIVDIVEQYAGSAGYELASNYKLNPSEVLKAKILDIYNNNWCKVRTWGTFGEELTFRITSNNFNWYNTIVEFLLRHPRSNTSITVETSKNGKYAIYWDKIPYSYAIDPENSRILENYLKH